MKFLLIFTVCATLIACSNNSNSKWTDKDKENAYKGCMLGKLPNFTDEQMKKRCECYLEKVMALSPDPVKQAEIPMDKVRILNDDCTAQAKK
jgi:hypothetical protein